MMFVNNEGHIEFKETIVSKDMPLSNNDLTNKKYVDNNILSLELGINKYLPEQENVIFYYTSPSVVAGWEGIKRLDETNFFISGTSINNEGLVFIGLVNGEGFCITFDYPSQDVVSTFCYNGEYLGNKQFRLIGSYSTVGATQGNKGYIYTGELSSESLKIINNYIELIPPSYNGVDYDNLILHSISNKLIVGNADKTSLPVSPRLGIIYDLSGNFITAVTYPESVYTNLYGIWYNNDLDNYTIVGGYSMSSVSINERFVVGEKGFIVDYDYHTNTFSNWTTISVPDKLTFSNQAVTHLEGVSGFFNEPNIYSFAFSAIDVVNTELAGGYMQYIRHENGFMPLKIIPVYFQYDKSKVCFGDSVSDNILVGIIIETGVVAVPYQCEIGI